MCSDSQTSESAENCPELTCLAADSLARMSREQMPPETGSTVDGADYGLSISESLASYDRDSLSWRTSQICLTGESVEFSEDWPKSGMTRNGTLFQLPPSVLLTGANESGLLLTPIHREHAFSAMKFGYQRSDAHSFGSLSEQLICRHGLKPTVDFLGMMMGYPAMWTLLKDSATVSCPKLQSGSEEGL